MKRELPDIAGREDWGQVFARMMFFSLALLAATVCFRVLPVREWSATPILRTTQNWALIFLAVAIPPCGWRSLRRQALGGVDLRFTSLLLGATILALAAIVSLRAGLTQMASLGTAVAIWPIQTLDFAGGLLVPAFITFLLILLPHVTRQKLRAAGLLALAGIVAIAALECAVWSGVWRAAAKGTSAAPVHKQAPRGRSLA